MSKRRTPTHAANLAETHDLGGGWQCCTYTMDCGHERQETYPPNEAPPVARTLACRQCDREER